MSPKQAPGCCRMVNELAPAPLSPQRSLPGGIMGLSRSISGLGHAAANGFVKWSNFSKPNFAAVLHGINDMRFEEFPLASTLKEGQVLSYVSSVIVQGVSAAYY